MVCLCSRADFKKCDVAKRLELWHSAKISITQHYTIICFLVFCALRYVRAVKKVSSFIDQI